MISAPEQQAYANSVATEYFEEAFADEFPDGTDNAKKRSMGKPNVIFFLIDDLGEHLQLYQYFCHCNRHL
jgi:hypothetical protein